MAGEGGDQLPPFKLLSLRPDGTWQEIGDTAVLSRKVKADPLLSQASDALHGLIADLNEEGPRHSFVGRFIQPVDTRVLLRGSPETPGGAVPPAGFAVLGGHTLAQATGTVVGASSVDVLATAANTATARP